MPCPRAGIIDIMWRTLLIVVGLCALWTAAALLLPHDPKAVADLDPNAGWALLAVLGWMVGSTLLVSQTGMALLTGAVFGPWVGVAVAVVGGIGANAIDRGLGQYLPADALARVPRLGPRLDALRVRLAGADAWSIAIVRALPGMPGTPMSYAAGIARVPYRAFLPGMIAGGAPKLAVYALAGASLSDPDPVLLIGVGLGVLLVSLVGWWVRRLRQA